MATPRKVKFCPTALKKVFIGAHTPIWHHEYDSVWKGLSELNENVVIAVYELNQSSYGIKTKITMSPGALKKELANRKEPFKF